MSKSIKMVYEKLKRSRFYTISPDPRPALHGSDLLWSLTPRPALHGSDLLWSLTPQPAWL